jgi:hypothetical protein
MSLGLTDKIKAVALYHYLEQKKNLDLKLEGEMKDLQRKYEKKVAPLFEKVHIYINWKG